ncbi:glycosyltransferase [bacterium]|nr:glycosyltransferase [bacterium]
MTMVRARTRHPLGRQTAGEPGRRRWMQRTEKDDDVAVEQGPRMRPRIVHLLPWAMGLGGAQRFVADLAMWQRRFADVHVIFSRGARESAEHWDHLLDGIKVFPVTSTRAAERALTAIAPDFVHHHHPKGGWLMDRIGPDVPWLGTQHGWKENLHPSENVVPICGPHAHVVRHGVDLQRLRPRRRPRAGKEFVVGIVGRRAAEKVPLAFVEALLKHRPAGVRFRFVGRGVDNPHGRRIEALLAESPDLELVGDVPPERMPQAYHELDAVLIPSCLESTSYVAIEAMACGLPVIARRVEGLPDTVGEAGLLAETDMGLLEAVAALRDTPMLRRALGLEARRRSERLFDLWRMLADYARIYAERSERRVREASAALDASVVIPVRDTPGPWVRECIESVLAQQGARFETILVDDGSTRPDTLAALALFENHRGVRVIRRQHAGLGPALNAGITAADADLIIRHDSDDVMMPGRLVRQVALMNDHPEWVLCAGQMVMTDDQGREIRRTNLAIDPKTSPGDQPWAIAHPTVAMRRFPVMRLGGYANMPAEDLDLWCRLHDAGYVQAVVPEFFTRYRTHPGQVTAQAAATQAAGTQTAMGIRRRHGRRRPLPRVRKRKP